MNDYDKIYNYLILLVLGFLLSLNFHTGELQPWDEALYAVRGESIIASGNYIDQTDEALGGLYSSTSPPLTIWAINLNLHLFGSNLFAIRLFSVLCSFFSLIIAFKIAQKISAKYAIFAPILLCSSLMWNYYSRQAMTEIPLNFFFLLIFYLIIQYFETENRRQEILFAIGIELSVALALLTKITISLFPLLFLIIFCIFSPVRRKKILLSLCFLVGILFGSIWYIKMGLTHGNEFWNALFLPQLSTAVEGNSRLSGIFYYFNNLFISQPFSLLLIFLPLLFKNFRQKNNTENFLFVFFASWFISMFIVLSLSVTKNPHYVTYLLPPTIFLILHAFEHLENISRSQKLLTIIGILSAFFWSFSADFRHSLPGLLHFKFTKEFITLFLIIAICIVCRYYLMKYFKQILLFGLIILCCRIFYTNWIIPPGNTFGGEAITKKIKLLNADSVIYLYHKYNDGDSLRPQLYWNINHLFADCRISNYDIQKDVFHLSRLKSLENNPDSYIIYFYPDITLPTIDATIEEISRRRQILFKTHNYILFSKIFRPKHCYNEI